MLARLLLLKRIPRRPDFGLLILRVAVFFPLFIKHGTEKLFHFQSMAAHFPDPLHIGAVPSLLFAALSDGICSLLLVLGLGTRWAALVVFINVGAAWAFAHHFAFFGQPGEHGELIVLYLAAAAALFFTGAGRYSVDGALERGSSVAKGREREISVG